MRLKQTLVSVLIMILTSAGLPFLTKSDDQPLKRQLSSFPMKIGEWRGTTHRFKDKVYELLGVDDSLLAEYRNDDNENIQLYIGYYKSQREGKIIHSPKNCMPGSGWNIIESSQFALELEDKTTKNVTVMKLVLQKGIQRQIAIYWFQSRGRVITSEYVKKIYLIWDSITMHRTDGSFVRLISPITGKDEKRTLISLKQFAEIIYPKLNEFIPN